jgi:hypothetical protein
MTYDYEYTRERLTGGDHAGAWDIDNPDRVDEYDNQIHLASEVSDSLSGKKFKMICNDSDCVFHFEEELTTEQESTLTTIVNNHKNNA